MLNQKELIKNHNYHIFGTIVWFPFGLHFGTIQSLLCPIVRVKKTTSRDPESQQSGAEMQRTSDNHHGCL